MPEFCQEGERVFRGIPVSPGVCRGKILVVGQTELHISQRHLAEHEIPEQIARLEQALIATRQEIIEVQQKVRQGMGADDAGIFDAHLLVLEDRTLLDEVVRYVTERRVNIEYAFRVVADKYAHTLGAIDDEYLRERASDIRDITARVLNNLLGRPAEIDLRHLKEPCILISYDLSPSQTAMLDKKMALGIGTDVGSKTSHTAIMARSLHIPAVVGLAKTSEQVETGQYALLDGFNGILIIHPTDQTLFEYGQLVRKHISVEEKLKDLRDQPAITLDGVTIPLAANVEQPEDTDAVQQCGAAGVGLFRTEYLFINRDTLPTEEEQYQAYRQVAAALQPQPVVIRTLDLGGDKFLSRLQGPKEINPFLGWRAIRICLQECDIFRPQLRAILRASVEGNIRLMYPMISCLDELIQANQCLNLCKEELAAEKLPFEPQLQVGAMIETPSAALIADALAKRVSFFSIGTNDLIQYALAVDRMNEKIAHLYEPTHPAILRLIQTTVDAAHRQGIWVGLCGEMAGEPTLVPLLLGLGVDQLSAAPSSIPAVKYLIRRLRLDEARDLAANALLSESGAEIGKRAREFAHRIAPSLFSTL